MSIFQKSVINQHLLSLDNEKLEKAYKEFQTKYTRINNTFANFKIQVKTLDIGIITY